MCSVLICRSYHFVDLDGVFFLVIHRFLYVGSRGAKRFGEPSRVVPANPSGRWVCIHGRCLYDAEVETKFADPLPIAKIQEYRHLITVDRSFTAGIGRGFLRIRDPRCDSRRLCYYT
jgi:hypothetical protein